MTKKTRAILFIFLALLFFLAVPLTIFYSLGWRFDWGTKKIFQPGVFYFKILPKSSQIYLDGKLKKKTDFFFGSALIENLLPKKYNVEVKKEGFQNWKKELEIKKGEVTEAKNIILVRENPSFRSLAKRVKRFFFSPNGKKIILEEKSSTSKDSNNQDWALKLYEPEKNVKSHLIEAKNISSKGVQLVNLTFSPDSKSVLLELGLKERLGFYLLEINKTPPLLTPLDFLPEATENVYFHPINAEKLLVLKEGILSEVNLSTEKTGSLSSPVLENLIALSFFNNDVYYLDRDGFLFKTGATFTQKEKLNIVPFPLKEETEYRITVSPSYIFLKEGNNLYAFDRKKRIFERIFEKIKGFGFSPDFKKMVYFNDYEIWVLFLEKVYGQPQKEAGEQLFLTRFSEKIGEVFWYTNHYLIFSVGNEIKVAEIDDRDGINVFTISPTQTLSRKNPIEFKIAKIFWNQRDKKLYVLSGGNLYVSEKLLP